MRLSSFVRSAPKLFYLLAVLDLLRNLLGLAQLYIDGTMRSMDYGAPRIQILALVLSAIIYAAQWIAYGVFASLLIAIHDRISPRGATRPEAVE